MGCNDLKPPSPPTLESLPKNVNLPAGVSLDKVKSMASGKGLSDAMNNVGGLIGDNLKKLGNALNPASIADRIGSAVESIAGGIADRVNAAVDGLSNLKDQLKAVDPSATLEGLPGSPDDIKSSIKGKIKGALDFGNIQGSLSLGKCEEQFTKQAGEVNKQLKNDVKDAAKKIPGKDKIKMAKDAKFKQEKEKEIVDQVKQKTANDAQQQAAKPDKESRTAQDKIQSETLKTEKNTVKRVGKAYMDYMLVGPAEGWELYNPYSESEDTADSAFRKANVESTIIRNIETYRPTKYYECTLPICMNSSIKNVDWEDNSVRMYKVYKNFRPATEELTAKWEEYLVNNSSKTTTLYLLYIDTRVVNYEFDVKSVARVPSREVWMDEDGNITGPSHKLVDIINDNVTVRANIKLFYTIPAGVDSIYKNDDVNWDYMESTGDYTFGFSHKDTESAYKTAASRALNHLPWSAEFLNIYTRNEDI